MMNNEELYNKLMDYLKRYMQRDRTPILFTGLELSQELEKIMLEQPGEIEYKPKEIIKLPFTGV